MVTDIVVITYNRLDTLKKTLRYILERTTPGTYRLTVIDDDTLEPKEELQ